MMKQARLTETSLMCRWPSLWVSKRHRTLRKQHSACPRAQVHTSATRRSVLIRGRATARTRCKVRRGTAAKKIAAKTNSLCFLGGIWLAICYPRHTENLRLRYAADRSYFPAVSVCVCFCLVVAVDGRPGENSSRGLGLSSGVCWNC